MAKIMEQGPVLVLTFSAQQIMVLRDATGNIIEGGEVSLLGPMGIELQTSYRLQTFGAISSQSACEQ